MTVTIGVLHIPSDVHDRNGNCIGAIKVRERSKDIPKDRLPIDAGKSCISRRYAEQKTVMQFLLDWEFRCCIPT